MEGAICRDVANASRHTAAGRGAYGGVQLGAITWLSSRSGGAAAVRGIA